MSSADQVPADLRALYENNDQGHVFKFIDSGKVTREQAETLIAQLKAIDVHLVNALYTETMASVSAPPAESGKLVPLPASQMASTSRTDPACLDRWRKSGLEAISRGKVATLILAGGQGTRLGSSKPKGEYDVGLDSHYCLFELQCKRVEKLRRACGADGKEASLPVYIMTSPMTDADTRAFFAERNYFGLDPSTVRFFSQGTLPCLTNEGKMMLENGYTVGSAPDGNGGIYRALHESGCWADMVAKGVEGVVAFAVDNAAVRPADPVFVGFCMEQSADLGSKACAKTHAHEKVGVICSKENMGGGCCVVEYSEMDRTTAELKDASGNLVFGAGNLCIHYFSVDFLQAKCSPATLPKVYHVAKKAIPYAHEETGETVHPQGKITGIKLESFIFDVFPACNRPALLEVARDEEFAPVKNAPGSSEDTPEHARWLVQRLHRRWLSEAKVAVESEGSVEISPLVSYAGEGLEVLSGVPLCAPLLVLSKHDALPAGAVAAGAAGTAAAYKLGGTNVYVV